MPLRMYKDTRKGVLLFLYGCKMLNNKNIHMIHNITL